MFLLLGRRMKLPHYYSVHSLPLHFLQHQELPQNDFLQRNPILDSRFHRKQYPDNELVLLLLKEGLPLFHHPAFYLQKQKASRY